MKNCTVMASVLFLVGCSSAVSSGGPSASSQPSSRPAEFEAAKAPPSGAEEAIFAGGCFWCMEPPFEKLEGVFSVVSGYTGGKVSNPTYKQVSAGRTQHVEAVRVIYNPEAVSYEQLLEVFWKSFDPTDDYGQFADRGPQYRAGVYYKSESQKLQAERSKQILAKSERFDKPIVTPVLPAGQFWEAEAYHQDYYKKNAAHYNRYRIGSGRAGFLKKYWGDAR